MHTAHTSRLLIHYCQAVQWREMKVLAFATVLLCVGLAWGDGSTYYVGAGRYDITGPAAEVEMVRYALTRPYYKLVLCERS